MLLSEIGEGSEALFCLTNSTNCCANRGAWDSPSGNRVSRSESSGFYFTRGDSILLLNRRSGVTEPTGIFTCLVPIAGNTTVQRVHIGVYSGEFMH